MKVHDNSIGARALVIGPVCIETGAVGVTMALMSSSPLLSKRVLLEQLTKESSDQECMIKLSDIPSCSLFQIRHGTTCSLPHYASDLFNVRRSTHAKTVRGRTYVLLQGWMHYLVSWCGYLIIFSTSNLDEVSA